MIDRLFVGACRFLLVIGVISFVSTLTSGCRSSEEEWHTVKTDRFIVRARSKEHAELNAASLEEYAYPFLKVLLPEQDPEMNHGPPKFEICVLQNAEAQDEYYRGAHGTYCPVEGRITYGFVDENFPQTVFHEFSHMYLHQVLFRGDTDRHLRSPGWLDEGLAIFMETLSAQYHARKPLIIEDSAVTNLMFAVPAYRLPEVVEDIRDGKLWSIRKIVECYDRNELHNRELGYSWSLVAFCICSGRTAELRNIISHYQQDSEDDDPSKDLARLESDWKDWITGLLGKHQEEIDMTE